MRERYGFDMGAMDALERARAVLEERGDDDSDADCLVAAVLATRGDNTGALDHARRAVAAGGAGARAHTTLATLLVNGGAPGEGLEHARRAAMLDPDDPQVIYNLGLAEHVAGDATTARRAFERAAELIGQPPWRWWRVWR
jgi:Flp pilus assembly protein TadD